MLVIRLNDGETWTEMDGCAIVDLPVNISPKFWDEYIKQANPLITFKGAIDGNSQ